MIKKVQKKEKKNPQNFFDLDKKMSKFKIYFQIYNFKMKIPYFSLFYSIKIINL